MAKTKTFYLFDQLGSYIGPVEAEKCPDNATAVKPTDVGSTKGHPVWDGDKWSLMTHEDMIAASQARGIRNNLLTACDFTQVMDFQGDVDAWAKYRQDLRDITKQEKFPSEIVWPEKPSLKPIPKEPKK